MMVPGAGLGKRVLPQHGHRLHIAEPGLELVKLATGVFTEIERHALEQRSWRRALVAPPHPLVDLHHRRVRRQVEHRQAVRGVVRREDDPCAGVRANLVDLGAQRPPADAEHARARIMRPQRQEPRARLRIGEQRKRHSKGRGEGAAALHQRAYPPRAARRMAAGVGGRNGEGRIDRLRPVALHAFVGGVPEKVDHHRRAHRDEQDACRTVFGPGRRPAPPDPAQPGAAQYEDRRRREDDQGAGQFGQIAERPDEDRQTAGLIDQGSPLVLGVPDQHRGEDGQRQQPAGPGPRRRQPSPLLADAQEPGEQAHGEEDRGVFGAEAKAEREADRQPPRPAAAALELRHKHEEKAGRGDHRLVRRRDQRADRHDHRQVEVDHRGAAEADVIEQQVRRASESPACRDAERHRHDADAQGRVAEQARADPDHQRIDERMVDETGREMLGIAPVQDLVRSERRGSGHDELDQGQEPHEEHQPGGRGEAQPA